MKLRNLFSVGWAILLILAGCFFCSPKLYAADNIYISQVQITGGSKLTDNDFVEFFNPNDTAFNLKGFRLDKRSQGSSQDSLIKSWTSTTLIPPRSFYLWANSAFTSISVKPDAVTTATISDDNGIALRQGSDNTGVIIDALSWGNAKNIFPNISSVNPGASQVLVRENLYAANSGFTILPANPRNTKVSDSNSSLVVPKATPVPSQAPTAKKAASKTTSPSPTAAAMASSSATRTQASEAIEPADNLQASGGSLALPNPPAVKISWKQNIGYIALSVVSLGLFIFLLRRFFKSKA